MHGFTQKVSCIVVDIKLSVYITTVKSFEFSVGFCNFGSAVTGSARPVPLALQMKPMNALEVYFVLCVFVTPLLCAYLHVMQFYDCNSSNCS